MLFRSPAAARRSAAAEITPASSRSNAISVAMNTMTSPSTNPVALIAGPTASGKSALAVRLAEIANGVVINADASQVYADLRILSARPDDAEMARAPHRLFGYRDAATACSAADWAEDAKVDDRLQLPGRPYHGRVRAQSPGPFTAGWSGVPRRGVRQPRRFTLGRSIPLLTNGKEGDHEPPALEEVDRPGRNAARGRRGGHEQRPRGEPLSLEHQRLNPNWCPAGAGQLG